jgi:hypothetical protein
MAMTAPAMAGVFSRPRIDENDGVTGFDTHEAWDEIR